MIASLLAASVVLAARADDEAPQPVAPDDAPPAVAAQEAPPPVATEAPAPARAAPASDVPVARFMYSNFVAIRVNPLGLVDRVRFGYRHRLFKRDGILFEQAFVDAGAEATLAPTYFSAGPRLEIQPLAILNLSATLEYIGYFGVIGALMPLEGPQADFWEDALEDRAAAGENYATGGTRLTLSAVLQGKVGPIILRNTFTALSVDLDLKDGSTVSYDATQDLVLPDGGWAILNDLDFGAMLKKATFGVRYSYADALHGTGGPGDLPMHRVGPLFAWTFHDRPSGARFDKPTILVLLQWYPQHPYRSGQEQSAAAPLAAVAFSFEGDLWTRKR